MTKSITAKEMSDIVGGELNGDENVVITKVASLSEADSESISFLANQKYASQVVESDAIAVIVGKDYIDEPKEGHAIIVCENPNLAFSDAINCFAPPPIEFPPGVHSSAVVADSVKIGQGVHIGANAVIEEDAVIGDGSVIGAGCYIGHYTTVGTKCLIYPNVSIRERCVVGNAVIIHSGTTVGSDGFGFAAGEQGIVKIPQTGSVQLDDLVEIGANCTIDRARFGKTWLKTGVKLDNLVHIAHNVEVGEFTMLIGQCGIAGSTRIGRGAIVAAKAGVNGHITIGDGAKIAGMSGVVKSVGAGEVVVGLPAENQREFMTRVSLPKKVKKLTQKLKELEAKVAELS